MKKNSAIDWIAIVANLGVMAGLVLVAYEVRQATLQAEAEAQHAVASEAQLARQNLALSPELAMIQFKAIDGGVSALEPIEEFRLREWERANRLRIISQVRMYDLGFMSREFIENLVRNVDDLENGLWSDLGVMPLRPGIKSMIKPVREDMGLSD